MSNRQRFVCLVFAGVIAMGTATSLRAGDPWSLYEGTTGPGVGKRVVLISGDEEYRSEESLPQLGKILAQEHGFTCTVLYAIDPQTGLIDPNYLKNIPGLEALDSADLMILQIRMRTLPDEQMKHIDKYLMAGKPVIGLRTATHAFNQTEGPYAKYGFRHKSDDEWNDGFGRLVLGETWINHHGDHKHESTRGVFAPGAMGHPILRGIEDGEIWGPTDVYGVRLPLPGDAQPLVLGQVTERVGPDDPDDAFYGMRPTDLTPVAGEKNDPMLPIAWTKSYQLPGGKRGRSFTTTMGSSTDLTNEGVRRMIVNAAYWLLDLEVPAGGTRVDLVGDYEPTKYEFRSDEYWTERKMQVDELAQ